MPPDSVEPGPSFNPSDSGAVRRSSLLGPRKAHPHLIDKPQAFARMERPNPRPAQVNEERLAPELPAAPAPSPQPPPAPAPSPEPVALVAPARRTPQKKSTEVKKTEKKVPPAPKASQPSEEILLLRQQVEALAAALSDRPGWDDLHALERRLTGPPPESQSDAQHLTQLQTQLQTRQEELEELSALVAEFQEQSDQARHRLHEMEGTVQSLHEQLSLSQARQQEAEQRMHQSEGFLREALLGLLSPGDEFNEELVEQIQHFLAL